MDAANLRTPDDARKLWCATSNQMCRADECGHWVHSGRGLISCDKDDEGAEYDPWRSALLGEECYARKCARTGRCGLIHE